MPLTFVAAAEHWSGAEWWEWASLIHRADVQVSPQLARDDAPASGAVRWSRALFVRLKRTWARLQQQERASLQDPVGQRVSPD